LAFCAGTIGAVGAAAALVVRRRYPQLFGAPRLVAFGVLLTAGVGLAHLVPAALGVLSRGTALAAAVLVLVATSRLRRVRPGPAEPPLPTPPSSTGSWIVAGTAIAAVTVYALGFLREHVTVAITHSDYVTFTMPQIAR